MTKVNTVKPNIVMSGSKSDVIQNNSQKIGHANKQPAEKPAFKGISREVSGGLEKKIKWMGTDFTSAGQRLISGVTALMTQPFFDLYNDKTDEKTRIVSTARTLGKILAGMTTGVLIRHLCIKSMDRFCKTAATEADLVEKGVKQVAKTAFSKREQWLLPKKYEDAPLRQIKKYKNAFGTLAAVIIMIGTNFLIDAPLTFFLTSKFVKKFTKTQDSDSKVNTDSKSASGGKK